MALVASTKTFRSPNLTTLSIIPAWFSKLIEYWKPEQPPPTTPMRSPAGTGSCVAMISFTLATAAGVNCTGCDFAGGAPVTTSGVTAAVDMGRISLNLRSTPVYATKSVATIRQSLDGCPRPMDPGPRSDADSVQQQRPNQHEHSDQQGQNGDQHDQNRPAGAGLLLRRGPGDSEGVHKHIDEESQWIHWLSQMVQVYRLDAASARSSATRARLLGSGPDRLPQMCPTPEESLLRPRG